MIVESEVDMKERRKENEGMIASGSKKGNKTNDWLEGEIDHGKWCQIERRKASRSRNDCFGVKQGNLTMGIVGLNAESKNLK